MMSVLARTTRKRALSTTQTKEPPAQPGTTTTAPVIGASISSPTSSTSSSSTSSTSSATTASKTESSNPKAHIRASPWQSFQLPRSELDLSTTLKCGQSFRWLRTHRELPSGAFSPPLFSCVLNQKLWCLEETEDGFRYRTYRSTTLPLANSNESDNGNKSHDSLRQERPHLEVSEEEMQVDRAFLWDYFQLHIPLGGLYEKWSAKDKNFKAKAPLFPGVRILRQDPVENLVCFICSSNNNIGRISQMATKISQEYGSPIMVPADDICDTPRTFYGFPTIAALTQDGVEETLRQLGFGYRAKYIAQTAKKIHNMENGGLEWLTNLRNLPYEEAHAALLTLQGVGPKVADCVCLMSLDKQNVIPIDTHVWQIAMRDYKFRFEGKVPKSISPAVYKAIGKHFVDIFGEYAGWGHTVLFAADLKNIEGRIKIEEEDTDVKSEKNNNATAMTSQDKEVKKEEGEDAEDVSATLLRMKAEVVDESVDMAIPIKLERHSSTQSMNQGLEKVHLEETLEPASPQRRLSKRRRH
ncbi:8-oxoguanine glycosylase ogg1 [Podila humilis]|nr:8-oxoguanine glycosylase ogg1 [Podila humilis]